MITCELCCSSVIHSNCLKGSDGAFNVIARSRGALDSKGKPNYMLPSAGFSKGGMQMFLKKSDVGMKLGGLVGYLEDENEDGSVTRTFRFVFASCAEHKTSLTPVRNSADKKGSNPSESGSEEEDSEKEETKRRLVTEDSESNGEEFEENLSSTIKWFLGLGKQAIKGDLSAKEVVGDFMEFVPV